jgi:hypothetical protein
MSGAVAFDARAHDQARRGGDCAGLGRSGGQGGGDRRLVSLKMGLDPRLQQITKAEHGSIERREVKHVDGLFHKHVTNLRNQLLALWWCQ